MDPERERMRRIADVAGLSSPEAREEGRFVRTHRLAIGAVVVASVSALIAAGGLVVALTRPPAEVKVTVPPPVVTVLPAPVVIAPPAAPR